MLEAFGDFLVGGLHGVDEVPQQAHRANGDVEGSIGLAAVLKTGGDEVCRVGAYLHRLAARLVDAHNLGTLFTGREKVLVHRTVFDARSHHVGIHTICRDVHKRVEGKRRGLDGLGLHFSGGGAALLVGTFCGVGQPAIGQTDEAKPAHERHAAESTSVDVQAQRSLRGLFYVKHGIHSFQTGRSTHRFQVPRTAQGQQHASRRPPAAQARAHGS